MFDIATVSFSDPAAPVAFAKSLRETGFAVLSDHPIKRERIEATYADWGRFFNSDGKHQFTIDTERQDGFFPFRSENAKDS
ncbi:MAG: isopenicillin N synthase family oxygenase, partial [Pseudomonadota bacterium]